MERGIPTGRAWPWLAAGAAGVALAATTVLLLRYRAQAKAATEGSSKPAPGRVVDGVAGLIGNTPLIRLHALSKDTGCDILAKAEYLNPGGSSKDRIALQMVRDAEAQGRLKPGGWLVEGTSGSTGISLATLAAALGYRAYIVMPDDQAKEKAFLLRQFGATVQLVKPVSIVNENHYVNVARRVAGELARGDTTALAAAAAADATTAGQATDVSVSATNAGAIFCDQFENESNFRAHYLSTGPEIWEQTGGKVDAFVSGAGTGGTLAGVAQCLKEHNSAVHAYLVDPPGSSLYAKVAHGVAFAPQQSERTLRRHRYDTIIEGVGIDRVTANFEKALPYLDGALQCTDQEAVEMSRYLLRNEGLFVGSSTSMNCVGAVKLARMLGPGHTIVTILCDSGMRHMSRFWSADYVASQGLSPAHSGRSTGFVL